MAIFQLPTAAQLAPAANRALARCDSLAACTETPGQITRTFCSPAMRQAHQLLQGWFESLGMTVRLDAAGNLIGRYLSPAAAASKRVLLIGSHLDTVRNAGRYDGILGVIVGLALCELAAETHTPLPFHLDVIAFSEEEGVRFQTPYIGSRAIVGDCSDELLATSDRADISIADALTQFGCDVSAMPSASYDAANVVAFIEPHIEQGPVLELENVPVAVVSGIAGQSRAAIMFHGQAGHAGTVPMTARRDALAAAAEFVLAVENVGRQHAGMVATVGQLVIQPNVGNVIAGDVVARLDLRHLDDTVRMAAFRKIEQAAAEIATRRGLKQQFDWVQHQPATPCDANLTDKLTAAVKDCGLLVRVLPSGAGHDAAIMARSFPAAMLFIRCCGGISHHPDEAVTAADVATAIEVLWHVVGELSKP